MFIGVILDYPETPTQEGDDEANEDNNDAWFEIIFDCKGKVRGAGFLFTPQPLAHLGWVAGNAPRPS